MRSERSPQLGGVVRSAEELVAELARIAGARDPGGNVPDLHGLREEAEVAQAAHVGVAHRREQFARTRPLELNVRQRCSDRCHHDIESVRDALEMGEVGVERRDYPRVLVVELEDGSVADHLAVLVAERRIPDLPRGEAEHVVGEDPVRGRQRVRTAEVPLAQRRFVPDAHALSNGAVLGDRIPEVVGPKPALPVHELAAELSLDGVERRLHELRAHVSAACGTSAVQPSSSDTACACSSSGSTAACIASRSNRDAGPCTPMIAASSPWLPQTGAATACRSSSRSPKL